MAHNSSLPAGDREESPEKYCVKFGNLTVAIYPESGLIRMDIEDGAKRVWHTAISPEDVARMTTTTPYFLPEIFKEVNEALRVSARIAIDQ